MNSDTISYTEEDLRDAWHTHFVDLEVTTEQGAPPHRTFTTDEQKCYWYESTLFMGSLDDPEDLRYFEQTVVPQSVERYRHGKAILTTCKLVSSSRSIVLGDHHYEEITTGETIVSPVVAWPSGYIATSEAYRYIALALRKSGEERE